jgi:hypothetical protein
MNVQKPQLHVARIQPWAALAFTLLIIVGGFFYPLLGLGVPLIMLFALGTNLFSKKWFCARACPRMTVFGAFGPLFSRYRPAPKWMTSKVFRYAFLAFFMVCSMGQAIRLMPNLYQVGAFFWRVCLVTYGISFALAVLYKPRTWCAFCPIGTLQTHLALPKR